MSDRGTFEIKNFEGKMILPGVAMESVESELDVFQKGNALIVPRQGDCLFKQKREPITTREQTRTFSQNANEKNPKWNGPIFFYFRQNSFFKPLRVFSFAHSKK